MKKLDSIRLIGSNTNLGLFSLISIIYGVVFGGLFNILDSDFNINKLMITIIFTAVGYFSIFQIAVVSIFLAQNSKVLLSLSASKKIVIKIWNSLLIISAFVMSFSAWGFLIFVMKEEYEFGKRLFNMRLEMLTIQNSIKLLPIFVLCALALTLMVSLISSIGNKYGLFSIIGMILITISLLIFLIPLIKSVIIWGDYITIICIVLAIFNFIIYFICKKLIYTMEVMR